jgi:hypothetical protein
VPHAIEVAGIEQGDAAIESGVNGRDTLVFVRVTVHA